MNEKAKELLAHVGSWPEEDQAELLEIAREIEARRTGTYVLTEAERSTIAEARGGAFAPDRDVMAFWKRHGIA